MAPDRLGRILERLASIGPEPSTRHLCEVAAELTGMTGAGIMVFAGDAHRGSLATTDEVAAVIESLQYTLGEGPCIDAYRSNEPSIEGDLERPTIIRWSAFGPAALAAGARAIGGFPLRVGSVRLGSLNLYRDRPGALDEEQYADALVVADVICRALLTMQGAADPEALAAGIEEHANFGYEIHQASGMISVQLGVGVEEALVRLRAHAFSTGRLAAEIASEVVTGRLRFDEADPTEEVTAPR